MFYFAATFHQKLDSDYQIKLPSFPPSFRQETFLGVYQTMLLAGDGGLGT